MAIKHDEVLAQCEAQPGFADGNAYSRAKVCCRVLMQSGEAVPSWMVIRAIIGKGSSGDISRGIKDFRAEHGERLRQMNGIVSGLPEHLAPLVVGLWEASVTAARAEFAANTRLWQEQIEQSEARADLATQREAEAEVVISLQRAQIEALDTKVTALDDQVRTERAGREQAERMFAAHTADMNAQREKLEAALKENKTEMDRALERFDGERRYAMRQIEEARAKAATEVAALRSQAQRETSALALDVARLNTTVLELRAKLSNTERIAAVATQEASDLRARLMRAEVSNDQLSENNRKMVALIKNKGAKANTPRLRKTKLRIATTVR